MKPFINKPFYQYIIVIAVLALPFLYYPGIFNPYEYPRLIVFVVGIVLANILLLVHSVCFSSKVPIKIDRLTILVLSYLLIVLIADIVGLDPRISLLGNSFRLQGFLLLLYETTFFFLVRTAFFQNQKERLMKLWTGGILLGGVVISFIAISQAIALYLLHNYSVVTYQGRIMGSFGNPDFLGGYIVVLLPFVLEAQKLIRIAVHKNFFIAFQVLLTFLIVTTILLSASRAALLALLGIILIYKTLYLKKIWLQKKVKPLVISGIGICFFFGVYFSHQSYFLNFRRNSIWDNRLLIWSEGIKAFAKRPILGYGQENFELVFPAERKITVDNAHNIFLETAISSGFVGLLFFLGIFFVAIRKASRPVKLALIAFLITAEFNPLSIAQITFFWFLLAAS